MVVFRGVFGCIPQQVSDSRHRRHNGAVISGEEMVMAGPCGDAPLQGGSIPFRRCSTGGFYVEKLQPLEEKHDDGNDRARSGNLVDMHGMALYLRFFSSISLIQNQWVDRAAPRRRSSKQASTSRLCASTSHFHQLLW